MPKQVINRYEHVCSEHFMLIVGKVWVANCLGMLRGCFGNASGMVRKWFANGSQVVRVMFGRGQGSGVSRV